MGLRDLVEAHQLAMEDEGYARAADRALWADVDRAETAGEVATAIAAHRVSAGLYPTSADEELWAQAEMEQAR